MSRLTRGGTAGSVSRDHILRRECGQGNINFLCLADHEQDCQPYPFDLYSPIYYETIHKNAELALHLKIERRESERDGKILRDVRQDGNFAIGGIGNLAR